MIPAEAGHFQRIGHAAACFEGQVLNDAVDVIVGHQYRAAFLQQGLDLADGGGLLSRGERARRLGPGLRGATGPGRIGQAVFEEDGIGHV